MAARLTFREKAGRVCHQRVLRDSYDVPPPVDPETLSVRSSVVRRVSYRFASSIILRYEWLGTMATVVQRCYGIFYGMHCAGVSCFSHPGGNIPAIVKQFGLTSDRVTYLGRGACVHWAPRNTNSRLVNLSCRMERAEGKSLAVAFADTDAGEIGTIYQACGWACVGRGSTWFQYVSPGGKIISSNALTARREKYGSSMREIERRLQEEGWRKQETNPKWRYVLVLDRTDRDLVRRVEELRVPYPKREHTQRAGSDTSDTDSDQGSEDGAAPIPALMEDGR